MLTRSTLFAATALLALSGCGEAKVETAKADSGTKVSIAIAGDPAAKTEGSVDIDGDTETGKVEIKLPGGLEAKVNLPEGVANNAKFDIGGVGLYPGAKIGSVKVNATERKGDAGKSAHNAVVTLGFTAPADAAAVADWYQQQFDAKKVAVRRSGETLTGKTEDGDDFTLALSQAASGSKGVLTIIDAG